MKIMKQLFITMKNIVVITWPKLLLSIIWNLFDPNCLLQEQMYYYIKIIIKIFKVYCNEIFCSTSLLTQILLQHFA